MTPATCQVIKESGTPFEDRCRQPAVTIRRTVPMCAECASRRIVTCEEQAEQRMIAEAVDAAATARERH